MEETETYGFICDTLHVATTRQPVGRLLVDPETEAATKNQEDISIGIQMMPLAVGYSDCCNASLLWCYCDDRSAWVTIARGNGDFHFSSCFYQSQRND